MLERQFASLSVTCVLLNGWRVAAAVLWVAMF